MFSRISTTRFTRSSSNSISRLREELQSAETIVIGAGSGLSTSAGFTYSGERFRKYFGDFADKYGFHDMYSGGFYPFATLEEHWAYWSRYIYINRYQNAPLPVYNKLYELVKDKDYFVLTTNVDHQFQRAGFEKHMLFYTQGDYGLFQCSRPCHQEVYDNCDTILEMLKAQGYQIDSAGSLTLPENIPAKMTIPTELVPHCPKCGRPMSMNLRADSTFVQDEGWYAASQRYTEFLRHHENLPILFWELGVGGNTPGIIKYPFWQMTAENPNAVYACINQDEACCPSEIAAKSICINQDIGTTLMSLVE